MSRTDLIDLAGVGIVVIVGALAFFFWLSMLIHALSNPIKDKLVWVLILILLAPVIGPLLYYFIVKNKK